MKSVIASKGARARALAVASLVVSAFASTEAHADVAPVVDVALVPPVSFFGWERPDKDVYGVDLNIVFDRSRNVYGLATGMFSVVEKDMWGLAINGVGTSISRDVYGLQLSGFYNYTGGDFGGVQLGVFKNSIAGLTGRGLQLSVYKNESLADFQGMQLTGIFNETSGFEAKGLFVAGILNWADAEITDGFQASAVNLVSGEVNGLEIGAANIVTDSKKVREGGAGEFPPHGDVTGMQISVVNIGSGWVKGVQAGLFNYAGSLTGAQLGLINLAPGKGSLSFFPGINPGFATERSL